MGTEVPLASGLGYPEEPLLLPGAATFVVAPQPPIPHRSPWRGAGWSASLHHPCVLMVLLLEDSMQPH